MMQNKKLSTGFLVLAMFMLVISGAQATVTWITPGASATISGSSYYVNLTSGLTPLSNCSVTISSSNSGDSATGTAYNYTGSVDALNFTLDTTALEDANDYTFSATCYNTTGDSETGSRTGVTVDNTVPTAPSSISPSTSDTKDNVAISATVTGAETTACTLTLTSSYHTETVSMTHSSNTCTVTQDFPGSGDWTLTVTASDGTNSTSSSVSDLKITEEGGMSYVPSVPSVARSSSLDKNKKMFYVLLLGVGVFVAYQQGWFNKGGKTKRRKSRRKKKKR